MGDGLVVYALGLAQRVAGNRHRFAASPSHRRHLLPELFGDERNQRVRQPQDGFQGADQGAAGGAFLRIGAGLDLYLGDFQVPVAELVPDKAVNGPRHVVEPVVGKAGSHLGLNLLQHRADPAVGWAEHQVAVRRAAHRAFGLGVLFEAAVLALAVHQHEAAGVPELVAEVAVALAALGIEVDAAPQRGQRGKGESQRIGAKGRDAGGEFFFGVLAHLGRGFGLAQTFCAFGQQLGQGDAVNQVHRVEHIALGLAHLLALCITHQAVDVDVAKRHPAGEVGGHHDHPGDPEEDDVVAGNQHAAG